jgi:PTH1 family peptidyl-tRNA hydrolase
VLRIRPHGGAGGHNGVRSILEELGTDRFPRLRVGVGNPRTDAVRHVLGELSPAERSLAEITVAEAAEALAWWLAERDLERCMSRFHSRWKERAAE